jgi:hypothetical protein
MVREFFGASRIDLGLKDYEGNCDLCFKKSLKKRLTIIKENPEKREMVGLIWNKIVQEIPRFD